MLINECNGCKYLIWQIAIGLGVRCGHPDRKVENELPITINKVIDCKQFEKHIDNDGES